jgi:hypothetical protein
MVRLWCQSQAGCWRLLKVRSCENPQTMADGFRIQRIKIGDFKSSHGLFMIFVSPGTSMSRQRGLFPDRPQWDPPCKGCEPPHRLRSDDGGEECEGCDGMGNFSMRGDIKWGTELPNNTMI